MTENTPDLTMKVADLYHEQVFTDRRLGSVKRLTPVDGEGNRDPSRDILFVGSTQLMTPMGALPLSFEIEADSLEQAVEDFGKHAEQALEETMRELQELRREQQSSIVVPGASGGQGLPGNPGMGGGGFGGLKMP